MSVVALSAERLIRLSGEIPGSAAGAINGPSEGGQMLGFDSVLTCTEYADEGHYFSIHEDWLAQLQDAMAHEVMVAR